MVRILSRVKTPAQIGRKQSPMNVNSLGKAFLFLPFSFPALPWAE